MGYNLGIQNLKKKVVCSGHNGHHKYFKMAFS